VSRDGGAPRVLIAIGQLGYGGAERQVVDLARVFRSLGHEPVVCTLLPAAGLADELTASGVPVVSLGLEKSLLDGPLAVTRFRRVVRTARPATIHSHMVHANILTRLVRPAIGWIPVVNTLHAMREVGPRADLAYRLTRAIPTLTTHVTSAGLDRYLKAGAVRPDRSCVVPNGIDLTRFARSEALRGQTREALGLGASFTWLAIGRLNAIKNYGAMLRASRALLAAGLDHRLLIVGEGPERPALEALRRELELEETVTFLGVRRDVDALLNAADAVALSSVTEALPMALLEAAAVGKAIVAADVGGVRDVVLDGESGLVVPPGDQPALERAMIDVTRMEQSRLRAWGDRAVDHVRARFSLRAVAERWIDIYASARRRRPDTPSASRS